MMSLTYPPKLVTEESSTYTPSSRYSKERFKTGGSFTGTTLTFPYAGRNKTPCWSKLALGQAMNPNRAGFVLSSSPSSPFKKKFSSFRSRAFRKRSPSLALTAGTKSPFSIFVTPSA